MLYMAASDGDADGARQRRRQPEPSAEAPTGSAAARGRNTISTRRHSPSVYISALRPRASMIRHLNAHDGSRRYLCRLLDLCSCRWRDIPAARAREDFWRFIISANLDAPTDDPGRARFQIGHPLAGRPAARRRKADPASMRRQPASAPIRGPSGYGTIIGDANRPIVARIDLSF